MVEVDAGVDDGDVDVDPLVRAVDGGGRAEVRVARSTPVGVVCAVALTFRSTWTYATRGSASTSPATAAGIRAA